MKKLAPLILYSTAISVLANTAYSSASESLVSAYWEASDSYDEQPKKKLINAASGDVNTLYQWLKKGPIYRTDVPRGVLELQRHTNGGARFPYIVVVPDTYNAQQPIAVEFMLHGAVNQPRWSTGGKWWGKGKKYSAYLARNQITVFPAAWRDAVWWSDAQADNLVSILHSLKTTYNIDDNRVYLSGVSDGGTGTYFFAFKQPSEWAAFLPYIGHIGVLTSDDIAKVKRLDVENLVNSALFIVNGEKDRLYPPKSITPFIRILETAHIDHVFTLIKNGRHDTKWLADLQPAITAFKQSHLRDPLPEKLRWMTDRVDKFERIHWLRVDKLKAHSKPGWISALRKRNTFTLLTENISRFTLLLNPDEVDFTQPISVVLNGEIIFNNVVTQDTKVLLKWANNRDKTQLFTAELTLE